MRIRSEICGLMRLGPIRCAPSDASIAWRMEMVFEFVDRTKLRHGFYFDANSPYNTRAYSLTFTFFLYN